MSGRRTQTDENGESLPEYQSLPKKLKSNSQHIVGEVPKDVKRARPKSKKELRAEKKALKKAAAAPEPLSKEDQRAEKIRQKKEHKKEFLKKQESLLLKEIRMKKKIWKEKKIRREMNAPGSTKVAQERENAQQKKEEKSNVKKRKTKENIEEPQDLAMDVFNKVFNGTNDDTTGATTLRLGVKYIDIVEGKGTMVQDNTLITVSYKLKAGKYGATIDSSKKFIFRLGKGEVIQGWDIGLSGMKQGGRRHLIVPPKAGYGSKDIGAGPGGTLFFDVILLSC